jgi:dynactin complex subunit
VDSFPPYRAEINGVPVVVYSIEDDKKIIICMEEREMLIQNMEVCEQNIDSSKQVIKTYENLLGLSSSLLAQKQDQLDMSFWANDILKGEITMQNDRIKKLQKEVDVLEKKRRNAKTRNTILYSVGGTILTGILVGLIVRSVL